MRMRMQRAEWLQAMPQRRRPPTHREIQKMVSRRIRTAILNEIIPDRANMPPVYEWEINIPTDPPIKCLGHFNTKSEARAAIKESLGSVPKGTTIVKTGNSPRRDHIQQRMKDAYLARSNGATEGGEPQPDTAVAGGDEPACATASPEPGLSDA